MKTHQQLAKEAVGFAPRQFTPAEWEREAARIRKIQEKRKARKEGK